MHENGLIVMYILGRTLPEEVSASPTDLHLTKHNIYKRQISIHPAGFEFAIPESKLPKTGPKTARPLVVAL